MKLYNRLLQSNTAAHIVTAAYRFRAWLGVSTQLYRLPKPYGTRTEAVIKENYLSNLSLENGRHSTRDRIINDQGGITGKLFRFGSHHAWYNACEAIAIHNALLLSGRKSTLSRAIFNIQRSGAMWRMGEWGSDPCLLGAVLKRQYGFKVRPILSPKKPLKDGVYIISYWNTPNKLSGGVHTVAVLSENGRLRVYNDDFRSLSEKRFEGRLLPRQYRAGFIIGYQCRS